MADLPTLPNDEALERALVGAVFSDPHQLEALRVVVRATDFYLPAHQAIWQALLNCHGRGEQIDSLTLSTEMVRLGRFEAAGGASYLEQVLDGVPDPRNAATYARKVSALAARRDLYFRATHLGHAALDTSAPDEQIDAALSAANSAWQSGGEELPTLTAREIDALEWPASTDWLVERWWAYEACGFLAAYEKSSKTVIALGMALSVATGSPWLWRWRVTKGPVVFVAEEDHKRRVQKRLRKVGRALGLDWRTDDLHIAAQEGCNLRDDRGRGRLAATVRRVRPVWLIVDPWRRVTPGMDENDSREVSELLAWLRALQVECQCAVTVLDHMRKPAQGGQDSARASHKIRGSGDKGAWYDSFLTVVRKDETTHVIGAQHRDAGVGPLERSDANPGGELTLSIAWDDDHDEVRFSLPGCGVQTLAPEQQTAQQDVPTSVQEEIPLDAYADEVAPF